MSCAAYAQATTQNDANRHSIHRMVPVTIPWVNTPQYHINSCHFTCFSAASAAVAFQIQIPTKTSLQLYCNIIMSSYWCSILRACNISWVNRWSKREWNDAIVVVCRLFQRHEACNNSGADWYILDSWIGRSMSNKRSLNPNTMMMSFAREIVVWNRNKWLM